MVGLRGIARDPPPPALPRPLARAPSRGSADCAGEEVSARKDRGPCQHCGKPLAKGQTTACSRQCAGHLSTSSRLAYSPDQDALIERLWNEGVPTPAIGERLGITKNAAIGRIHRLGLPPRRSPIIRNGEKRAARPRIHRPHRAVSTLPPLASAPRMPLPVRQVASLGRRPPLPAAVQEIDVEQLKLKLARPSESSPHRTCQWVLTERPYTFCGKPSAYRRCDDGETVHWYSWCSTHRAAVFVRQTDVARAA